MSPKSIELLSRIQQKQTIQFEAHYWGKFELLAIEKEVWGATKGPIPIAKKVRDEKTLLYFNPINHSYSIPTLFDKDIAFNENEFWDLESQLSNKHYFDNRQSFKQLLNEHQYIITNINDPEYFDEIEAYFDLVHQFEKLSQDKISFDEVSGKVLGEHEKEIYLTIGTKTKIVQLNRELFDRQIIDDLNAILLEMHLFNFLFEFTIDEKMRMVLLRLNKEEFTLFQRMGILM